MSTNVNVVLTDVGGIKIKRHQKESRWYTLWVSNDNQQYLAIIVRQWKKNGFDPVCVELQMLCWRTTGSNEFDWSHPTWYQTQPVSKYLVCDWKQYPSASEIAGCGRRCTLGWMNRLYLSTPIHFRRYYITMSYRPSWIVSNQMTK